MKADIEVEDRFRLIKGLLQSHEQEIIELSTEKITEFEKEIEVLKWVLGDTEINLKRKMPFYQFNSIPIPTKQGKSTRQLAEDFIKQNPLTSRTEIAKALNMTSGGVIPILDALVELGKVKCIRYKSGVKFHYYSTDKKDEDMVKELDNRLREEWETRELMRKKKMREKYHNKKHDKKHDWKKAKKLVPILDKMKDEKLVDRDKQVRKFSEALKGMTTKEKEEIMERINPIGEENEL